jgi:hypothetical protein
MSDNNYVLAVIAFLVLVSILAVLVALARGRQRRFDPEKNKRQPLDRNAYLGGMLDSAGSPATTVAAATAAAFAALEDLAAVAAAAVAPSTATAATPPAGPSQLPVAADRAIRSAPPLQQMDMGDGVIAYYAERTGLPTMLGFDLDPNAPTYFVFEKLCPQNWQFWWQFVSAQRIAAERRYMSMHEGAVALQQTIQLHRDGCSEKFDMWIAYVSNVRPTTTYTARRDYGNEGVTKDATGIEMVVSVLVHRESPVTTHSGIFRTYKYWRPLTDAKEKARYVQKNYIDKGLDAPYNGSYFFEAVGHRNLSTLLHAFAAAAALQTYPHLRDYDGSVMVTRPVLAMGNILRKGLIPGEYTVGSPDERTAENVQVRHALHAENPENDGYLDGAYEPPLGQAFTPFFVAGVDRGTGARTWTFGNKVYNEPEWLQSRSACEHIYSSVRAHDKASLEYTVLLHSLARGWWAGALK